MTIYLAGARILLADSSAELEQAAALLPGATQIAGSGTPAERIILTPRQESALGHLQAVALTVPQAHLWVDAKQAGWPCDVHQLRRNPALVAASVAAAQQAHLPTPGPHPRRIQIPMPGAWLLPDHTVRVTAPTPWASPFPPARRNRAAHQAAARHFRAYLGRNPDLAARGAAALAGLHLACLCPLDADCHADAWLEIANPNTISTATLQQ